MRNVRNFLNQNRRDILMLVLGAISAFVVAKYKLAWLVF
jgi:hypothetical protein